MRHAWDSIKLPANNGVKCVAIELNRSLKHATKITYEGGIDRCNNDGAWRNGCLRRESNTENRICWRHQWPCGCLGHFQPTLYGSACCLD